MTPFHSQKQSLLNRRAFLEKTGWFAAGVTVLFSTGCSLVPTLPTLSDDPEEDAVSWIQALPNGKIRFFMGKAEMGQGILTGLTQIVAEEFNMPVEQIEVALPHTNQVNPIRMTVGSDSLQNLYLPLRQAAAQLKAGIVQLAAKEWNTVPSQIRWEADTLYWKSQNKPLVELLARYEKIEPVTQKVALKPAQSFQVMGKSTPRLDIPNKVNGSAQYTHDIHLPSMLYGKVVKSPVWEGKLVQANTQTAETAPGVIKVLTNLEESWVGLVAETPFELEQAVALLQLKWETPKTWEQSDIDALLSLEVLQQQGESPHQVLSTGDWESQWQKKNDAMFPVDLSFSTPFHAHAFMETQAGVAHVKKDKAEVWLGSQDPFFHQAKAAQLLGFDKDQVTVHPMLVGGGFGGKVYVHAAMEAVVLSQAVQRPVKVLWSREESMQYSYYRSPSQHRCQAAVNANGEILAWNHQFTSGRVIFSNLIDSKLAMWLTSFIKDPGSVRGSIPPYRLPHANIESWIQVLPVATGATRGLSAPINAFAIEVMMDALAYEIQMHPVAFRLKNLEANHVRLRKVLEALHRHVDSPKSRLKAGKLKHGKGFACGIYKEVTFVAVYAEVEVDLERKQIRVQKLVCAHDCGLIINPDAVQAQVEGNLIWGCSMALTENLTVQGGRMAADNFDQYAILTQQDAPDLEVLLINRPDLPPSGAGEAGIMPTPAAIANAVFDATQQRLTHLPLRI